MCSFWSCSTVHLLLCRKMSFTSEYFIRAASALHEGGSAALNLVWADKSLTGLKTSVTTSPLSQQDFYKELEMIRIKQRSGLVGVTKLVFPNMVDLVLPPSKMTDVREWDITLHATLLLQITNIKSTPNLPKVSFDDPKLIRNS